MFMLVTFAGKDISHYEINKAAMMASCLLTWPSIQLTRSLSSHRALPTYKYVIRCFRHADALRAVMPCRLLWTILHRPHIHTYVHTFISVKGNVENIINKTVMTNVRS